MSYRSWVVIAALALTACPPPHGPAIPALPSKGGPAWVEVTSPHFIVWTDSSEARARVLAQQMEDYRRAILHVLFMGKDPGAPPTLVFALRDAEEVGAYLQKQFVAYAAGGGRLYQPVILVDADTPDADNSVFVHELTHAITFGVIPYQPKWFAEGLAGYFATVRPRIGGDAVEIGRPLDYVVERLRTNPRTPTSALFACRETACMDDMFYATTWQVFAYLASVHPRFLGRYMDALAAQTRAPDAAGERALWDATFPELPPEQLDHEVIRWWVGGSGVILKFKFQSEPVTLASRPLRDADALVVRGILRWMFEPKARAELDVALQADPTNLLARLALSNIAAPRPEDAKATAAAHPDDWRAWVLVLQAERPGPDRRAAHDKICALTNNAPPRSAFPAEFCAAR
ncbi:MAG TPA: hypothetical protein VGM88_08800 [Kofleriaceae bacterium]|jgi:hypothetical protein